jgi:hypothetical protein
MLNEEISYYIIIAIIFLILMSLIAIRKIFRLQKMIEQPRAGKRMTINATFKLTMYGGFLLLHGLQK